MTITNKTDRQIAELPFLLYRLLQKIADEKGLPIQFQQEIVKVDNSNLQANLVKLSLTQPLSSGASTRVTINYNGSIFGYSEVMSYVRDRISEQYSLIRPDALAYPMLAEPSFDSLRRRIDIAAVPFKQLKDEAHQLTVFSLPEDEKSATEVLNGAARAISFYSKMFGELKDYRGYTVIEVPDGWGSQASEFYLLQAAAAFKDRKRMFEVYHEVAHSWNALAKPKV